MSSIDQMIKKWERSGKGDGGRHDKEEDGSVVVRDPDNLTSVQLGKLEGWSQFALDCQKSFLSNGTHGKLSPWYLYDFWEQGDRYDFLLASTVTELTTAVGAVDANSVPAVIAASRSVGDSRSGKRKRTPRRRKRQGRET